MSTYILRPAILDKIPPRPSRRDRGVGRHGQDLHDRAHGRRSHRARRVPLSEILDPDLHRASGRRTATADSIQDRIDAPGLRRRHKGRQQVSGKGAG